MNGPVGIVGAGYVGLPLAQVFAEAGRQVLLVEVDEARRRHQPWRELRQGRPSEGLQPLVEAGTLSATLDYDRLRKRRRS